MAISTKKYISIFSTNTAQILSINNAFRFSFLLQHFFRFCIRLDFKILGLKQFHIWFFSRFLETKNRFSILAFLAAPPCLVLNKTKIAFCKMISGRIVSEDSKMSLLFFCTFYFHSNNLF